VQPLLYGSFPKRLLDGLTIGNRSDIGVCEVAYTTRYESLRILAYILCLIVTMRSDFGARQYWTSSFSNVDNRTDGQSCFLCLQYGKYAALKSEAMKLAEENSRLRKTLKNLEL